MQHALLLPLSLHPSFPYFHWQPSQKYLPCICPWDTQFLPPPRQKYVAPPPLLFLSREGHLAHFSKTPFKNQPPPRRRKRWRQVLLAQAKMMKDDAPSPRARILEDLGGGFHRPCQFEHEITGGAGWNEPDKERRIRNGEGETKNPACGWSRMESGWRGIGRRGINYCHSTIQDGLPRC